jgi:S1-C subfamily serine protease
MTGEKLVLISRFEAWLTPGRFYFILALLIFLNLFVWLGWKPLSNENVSTAVISGLQAERERLQGLANGSCKASELQSYGRGESGPLPSPVASGAKAFTTPQDGLVSLLGAAAVVIVNGDSLGSGFFIDPTTIVTNRHVIEGVKGETVQIASKVIGKFLNAKIVSVTRGSSVGSADFALLRVAQAPEGVKVLPIAAQAEPLQHVVAVGFPGSGIQSDQGQIPTPIFTSGDVSAVQPQSTEITLVIHTADISPGSSGGALVDRCGGVVGVNTFVHSPQSRAESRRLYALSSDSLRKFLDTSGQRYSSSGVCQAGRTN